MKKWFSAGLALILCALIVVPACNASSDLVDVQPESSLSQENIAVVSNPVNFQLVGDSLMVSDGISLVGADIEQFKASEIDGNYLFSAAAFTSVLDQAKDLKKAIYDGNFIAVFEESGIEQSFEATLNLPIQFPVLEEKKTQGDYITVGRMYGVESDGSIVAAEVAVPSDMSAENAYNYFLSCAADFSSEKTQRSVANVESSGRVGTARKYFSGRNGRANLDVAYTVYFEECADGNDYYLYHGYVDASPVDSEGYQLKKLNTSVGVFGDTANTMGAYPNSTTSGGSVSITVAPFQYEDYVVYLPSFAWEIDISDISIVRTHPDQYNHYWDLDFGSGFEGAYCFEPGGSIYVSTGDSFTIHTEHVLTVRNYSANEVDSTFFFICDPDGITQA